MRPVKKVLLAGAAVGAVVLIAASAAWACSPMPGNATLSAGGGEPGTTVEVTGRDFLVRPADWPDLEVRWITTGGVLLARAKAPDFKVSFVVPETAPAQRFVVVVQRRPNGGIEGQETEPFEVKAPAPPAAPDPATPMVPEVPVLTPAPGPRGAPSVAPAPVPPAAAQGAPTPSAGVPVVPGPLPGTSLEPSPVAAPASAPSLLPSAAGASVAGPKVEVSTPEKSVLVDVRDLWSGVESGDPAASDVSLLAPSDSRSAERSRLGAGLLALAGVGLLVGSAMMVLTRRRAAVRRPGSRPFSE